PPWAACAAGARGRRRRGPPIGSASSRSTPRRSSPSSPRPERGACPAPTARRTPSSQCLMPSAAGRTGAHHTLASASDARYKTPESGLRFQIRTRPMEDHMQRWHKLVALVVGVAVLAGAGATTRAADAAPSASAPIQVGIVYSRTGLLASYGAQYIQGLRYGLAYATKGTNAVNGRKIELTLVDDATDPVKAVAGAKDLIGKGYKILAGTVSSGGALQMAPLAEQNKVLFISGPAATDAITGINRYTFRSGRQSYQDVLAASSYLGGGGGKNVTVFAQDSAFGLGNFLAVQQVMGNLGGQKVNRILVPLSAQDFTPFALQIKQQKTDLLFIAWAGTTAPAMWRALDQQGVFDSVDHVVTGLDMRASYPTFGPVANKISFLSHYVSNAPKNKVNDLLVESMIQRHQMSH